MNQVFKGTDNLPPQLLRTDVTGFRMNVMSPVETREICPAVCQSEGGSYSSASHIDKTRPAGP